MENKEAQVHETEFNPELQDDVKKKNPVVETFRRVFKNKLATLGFVIVILVVLVSVFANYLAPYDPAEQDSYNTKAPPSAEHLLGTDNLGRDILSRIMYGGRMSLSIGIISTFVAGIIGTVIGAACGYFGGALDNIAMRLLDILQAMPGMLLNICLAAALGAGFQNCIIALCIGAIPGYVRMMRASCLNIQNMEYIEAARSVNSKEYQTLFSHVIPNAISPIIVQLSMGVSGGIMAAAGLSFIGLGVQPPDSEWGAMLSGGRQYITSAPHIVIFPGLMIFLVILSLNMFGDGLRDALDPRLKN